MILALLAVVLGLIILVWSADQFVDGSAATAKHFGMPPLLIGMIVVGFGTSAPEMVVSAFASYQGNPGIALGNAYGSNIANIALILGITALISPIFVNSSIIKKELPILIGVTGISVLLIADSLLTRIDALLLIIVFAGVMLWSVLQAYQNRKDPLSAESEVLIKPIPLKLAVLKLILGLGLLIASSRILVWGSVVIATSFGVSDLIIGLTIIAVGTSLPELASSILAAKKGEHDIALGNILGSNLFNTLAVVGLAGLISPLKIESDALSRDVPVMGALTLLLFIFCYGFKGKQGRISRLEASFLLFAYLGYTLVLIKSTFMN
jgi:cation:H+ antiporter